MIRNRVFFVFVWCLILFNYRGVCCKELTALPFLDFGKAMVMESWKRFILELDIPYNEINSFSNEEQQMLKELMRVYWSLNKIEFIPEFRSGDDPIFKIDENREPVSAVTGPELEDPIVINLDRIRNSENFSFSSAVQLFIHELGHKIKKPTQLKLDQLASKIQDRVRSREIRFPIEVKNDKYIELYYCNSPHINSQEIYYLDHESSTFPIIVMIDDEKIYNLASYVFNEHLAVNADLKKDMIYRDLFIEQLEVSNMKNGILDLDIIIHHRVDMKSDKVKYMGIYKQWIVSPIRINLKSKNELHLLPLKDRYGNYTHYQLGRGITAFVDLDESALRTGTLSIKGNIEIDPQQVDIAGIIDFNGKISGHAIIEINGKRISADMYQQKKSKFQEYEMREESVVYNNGSWFYPDLEEKRLTEVPILPKLEENSQNKIHFWVSENLKIEKSRFLDFRLIGFNIKAKMYTVEDLLQNPDIVFIPAKQKIEKPLYKGMNSSLKNQFYLTSLEVNNPMSLRNSSSHTTFGLGETTLKLIFHGRQEFQTLKLEFKIEKNLFTSDKLTHELPLTIKLDRSSFSQQVIGQTTVVTLPSFNFGHKINVDNGYFPMELLESKWSLYLINIESHLNNSEYKETFNRDSSPKIIYAPSSGLTNKKINKIYEDHFNSFSYFDDVTPSTSCRDLFN